MVLSRAVSLATKGLKRTSHSKQEAESDGDEEGASNRNGGEVEIVEMTGERLSDDGD